MLFIRTYLRFSPPTIMEEYRSLAEVIAMLYGVPGSCVALAIASPAEWCHVGQVFLVVTQADPRTAFSHDRSYIQAMPIMPWSEAGRRARGTVECINDTDDVL